MNVLFLDDEPDLLCVYDLTVDNPLINKILCNNVSEALSNIDNNEIDVIISDFNMANTKQERDEFLTYINNKNIPILIITGCIDDDALLSKKNNENIKELIEKPFTDSLEKIILRYQ